MKPTNFEEWKQCITVKCGIPLTTNYINERLAALANPADYHTAKFTKTWGDQHRLDVINWLEQAKVEIAN